MSVRLLLLIGAAVNPLVEFNNTRRYPRARATHPIRYLLRALDESRKESEDQDHRAT